jgi:hypothetical protein
VTLHRSVVHAYELAGELMMLLLGWVLHSAIDNTLLEILYHLLGRVQIIGLDHASSIAILTLLCLPHWPKLPVRLESKVCHVQLGYWLLLLEESAFTDRDEVT